MRIGKRVEKFDGKKIVYFNHRVIIPIYIPSSDGYYKDLYQILKIHLESVFKNVNPLKTKITLIDNGSIKQVKDLLKKYLYKGSIDKLIFHKENLGKVLPLLSEIRSSTEDFITFSDCDVLFKEGLFKETFDLFKISPKIGAVSPLALPHTSHISTLSTLLDNPLRVVPLKWDSETIDVYKSLEIDSKVYSKLLKDYRIVIKRNGKLMNVGSTHVICTVKRECFRSYFNGKPEFIFANKMDQTYLDRPIDKYGMWRVGTAKFFAYHMGNNFSANYKDWLNQVKFQDYEIPKYQSSRNILRMVFPDNSDKINYIIRKLIIRWRT